MHNLLKAGLASTLALATATPALAQYQPTQSYQRDLDRYEQQRDAYQNGQQDYREARREYDRRLRDWERERSRYDRRYGYGAYAQAYGQRPMWEDAYRGGTPYAYGQTPYGGQSPYGSAPYSSQTPYGYQAPYAGGYGVNTAYANVNCNNGRTSNNVLGQLANAALGNRGYGGDISGAVLGAIVSGALGGSNNGAQNYKCDSRGPYYNQRDTIAYQENSYDRGRNSGQHNYSYYNNQRCRLAAAPVGDYGQEHRYIRVCPDNQGRYRITG